MKRSQYMKWLLSSVTIFEYYCLNEFCKPAQSAFIVLKDSYHNLTSPVIIKQNLWTLLSSWNLWMSIQSFVLSKCASTSSSGFPENSGMRCDQFNCGTCGAGYCSAWGSWGTWGAWGALGTSGAWGPGWAIILLIGFSILYSYICYLGVSFDNLGESAFINCRGLPHFCFEISNESPGISK